MVERLIMPPFPHLSELASSGLWMILALGFGLLLPLWAKPTSTLHRTILLSVTFLLAVRYTWWRATETLAPAGWTWDMLASWSFFAIEALAMLGTVTSFLLMSRWLSRSPEADAHAQWWGSAEPRVAILIPTYNEDREVLERTIVGAKSLRHQNKDILVLDDSRRDWLREFCADLGVRYMRRPDNTGSKAGNINHCLARLAEEPTPPDFVAVLDADFVPHRGFISRCLALFHDPKVGLVQTPQHFFNADPIQHNLGIGHAYPDEQRFFFDHMQLSRDAWGIAICCGTSSMVRWDAIRELGGLPTESITEDFMLSLSLKNKGWTTVYLAEPLTEGLAPEGLKEYITQRARWCLGLMQIARSSKGPFARHSLPLIDRISVIDSVMFWLFSFVFRVAVIVYPLAYWFGNIIVVNAALPDVLFYFGVYYIWSLLVFRLLFPGLLLPILHDVNQLIGAIPIARAAITGIIRPHGHPFSVTAKGGDRTKVVVQWAIMRPFLILFGLTLLGLVLGVVSDSYAYNDAGDGKWVVLFWTFYNLVVLAFTILACIELPRREHHVADAPTRGSAITDTQTQPVWVESLAMDRARLRGRPVPTHAPFHLHIPEIGAIRAQSLGPLGEGWQAILRPTYAQREALLVRFYAEGEAPGVGAADLPGILTGLARRLSGGIRP